MYWYIYPPTFFSNSFKILKVPPVFLANFCLFENNSLSPISATQVCECAGEGITHLNMTNLSMCPTKECYFLSLSSHQLALTP